MHYLYVQEIKSIWRWKKNDPVLKTRNITLYDRSSRRGIIFLALDYLTLSLKEGYKFPIITLTFVILQRIKFEFQNSKQKRYFDYVISVETSVKSIMQNMNTFLPKCQLTLGLRSSVKPF